MYRSDFNESGGYNNTAASLRHQQPTYSAAAGGAPAAWAQIRTMGFEFASGSNTLGGGYQHTIGQQQATAAAASRTSTQPPVFDEVSYDTAAPSLSDPYHSLRLASTAMMSTQRAWAQAVGEAPPTAAAVHEPSPVAAQGPPSDPGRPSPVASLAPPVAVAPATGMPAIGSRRRPSGTTTTYDNVIPSHAVGGGGIGSSSTKPSGKTSSTVVVGGAPAASTTLATQGEPAAEAPSKALIARPREMDTNNTPPEAPLRQPRAHAIVPTAAALTTSDRPPSPAELSGGPYHHRINDALDGSEPIDYSRSATHMSWTSQPASDDNDTDVADADGSGQQLHDTSPPQADGALKHQYLQSSTHTGTSSPTPSHRNGGAAFPNHSPQVVDAMAAPSQPAPIRIDHGDHGARSPFEHALRGGDGATPTKSAMRRRVASSTGTPLCRIDHVRDTQRAETLRAALHDATQRIAMLNKTLAQLVEGHALLHEKDVALRSEVAAAEAERAATQQQCVTLKADLEEGIEMLSQQLHTKRQRLEHLRRENERLRQALGDDDEIASRQGGSSAVHSTLLDA